MLVDRGIGCENLFMMGFMISWEQDKHYDAGFAVPARVQLSLCGGHGRYKTSL